MVGTDTGASPERRTYRACHIKKIRNRLVADGGGRGRGAPAEPGALARCRGLCAGSRTTATGVGAEEHSLRAGIAEKFATE